MTELIPGVGAGSLLHSQLLADDRSTLIGAVYRIDCGEAIVLTNDKWKFDADGIPQHSFLLAMAQDINTPQIDDDEVLLLRVEGTSPLAGRVRRRKPERAGVAPGGGAGRGG